MAREYDNEIAQSIKATRQAIQSNVIEQMAQQIVVQTHSAMEARCVYTDGGSDFQELLTLAGVDT